MFRANRRGYFSCATALTEIAVVVLLICSYIWILMPAHSFAVGLLSHVVVFAVVCLLQGLHRLPLKVQGVRFDNFAKSLAPVGLVTLVLICALVVATLPWAKPNFRPQVLVRFWWFLLWGPMQQFLLQSVLLLRVRSILKSNILVIPLSALIFSLVHLPNYYLMILSFGGALCWCGLFTRYPNIFALGLSHALLDLALLVIFPPELLGNLKVGPGFLGR